MKRVIVTLIATAFAALGIAATEVEAQRAGSPQAKAAAEVIHLKKQHGLTKDSNQVDAQVAANPQAQAVAEAGKARKATLKLNTSADQRLEFDHPNH